MEFTVLSSDEAKILKGFLIDDDYEEFVSNPNRYALCAIEEDKLCGVGIFDADSAAEIIDIIVTDSFREKLEATIVEKICLICGQLKCDGIIMEVYDEDGAIMYDDILRTNGFSLFSSAVIYRFKLDDLIDNSILNKSRPSKKNIALYDATETMKKVFSNELIQMRQYDRFMDENHDPFLSVVRVENDTIVGCALIDNLDLEYGFELAFLYASPDVNPVDTIGMISEALRRVNNTYMQPGAIGYITAMSGRTSAMVNKVIPTAQMIDHINRYIKVIYQKNSNA